MTLLAYLMRHTTFLSEETAFGTVLYASRRPLVSHQSVVLFFLLLGTAGCDKYTF